MTASTSSWRRRVYDRLAAISRAAPPVRGKGRLGWVATQWLVREPSVRMVRLKSGVRLRLDVSEPFQAWIYWTGEYDETTISRMLHMLPSDAVVFDVGAHIGAYTTQLARRLGPRCTIVAIEPRPVNLERLHDNIRLNEVEARTRVVPCAVGESAGRVWIRSVPGREVLTSDAAISLDDDDRSPSVPMATLDEIAERMGLERCDLIKLDVQGCELAALRGARRLLTRHRPVLSLEFSGYWMNHFGWSATDLVEFLHPLGYRLHREDGDEILPSSTSRGDAENVWASCGGT